MYVKFIDENTVEKAPRVIHGAERTIINPTPAILLENGYKPLVETECPNEEGYTYTVEYVEDEEQVTKTWVAHEIPEPEIVEEPMEETEEEETEPETTESEDVTVQA